jgi:hypothetical protein
LGHRKRRPAASASLCHHGFFRSVFPSVRNAVAIIEGVGPVQNLSPVSPFDVELRLTFLAEKS